MAESKANDTLTINGEEYEIGQTTAADFARVQEHCLTRQRIAKVQLAAKLFDVLPAEVAERQLDKARHEAERLTVPDALASIAWLRSEEGAIFVLYAMLDRQYPGRLTLDEVRQAVYDDANEGFQEAMRKAKEELDKVVEPTETQDESEETEEAAECEEDTAGNEVVMGDATPNPIPIHGAEQLGEFHTAMCERTS